MSLRLPLAMALAASLAPAAAHAAPADAPGFSARIAHEDLDLTTREGVTRLDERVRSKVRQLCATGGRDSASLKLERECRETALAAAAPAIRVAIAKARADQARFAANTAGSPAVTPGA